jgi:hypothetical protein
VTRTVYVGGIVLAGWVAVVGLLFPRHVDIAVPWALPPLHAQVIGALYLSGAVFMAAMARGGPWSRQSVVVPMIAVWTGGLLVVLLAHWDRVARVDATVVVWLVAYAVLPATELRRLWTHRRAAAPGVNDQPLWLTWFLAVAGIGLTGLALVLVVAPGRVAPGWPWPVEPFVLHVYAPPLGAFGLGFLLAAARPRADLAILLPSAAVFAAGTLAVSLAHVGLFRAGAATVTWFAALGVLVAGLIAGLIAGLVAGRRSLR